MPTSAIALTASGFRVGARTQRFETVSRDVSEKTLRHLAPAGVSRAEEQYSFH